MAGRINPLPGILGRAGATNTVAGRRSLAAFWAGGAGAAPPTAAGYTSLTAFWAGHTGAVAVVSNPFSLNNVTLALSGDAGLSGTLIFRYTLELDPGVQMSFAGDLSISGAVTYTSFASLAGYKSLLGYWVGGSGAYNPLTLVPSTMSLAGDLSLSQTNLGDRPPVVVVDRGAGSRRGRRRYYVATHKGRDYIFESMEEASGFLDQVREITKKKRGRPAKPKIKDIPVSVVESSGSIKLPDMSIIVPKRYFSPQEAEIALQRLREEAEDEDEVLILLGLL